MFTADAVACAFDLRAEMAQTTRIATLVLAEKVGVDLGEKSAWMLLILKLGAGALGKTPIAPAPESAPDGGKSARRADPNQEQAVFPHFAFKMGSPVGAKPAVQTTAAKKPYTGRKLRS